LPGRPYYELLEKQSDGEWLASVERVVGLVERLAACVATATPITGVPGELHLADEARWALTALQAEDGLTPERAQVLEMTLARGGAVSARPQHGDLWPPNVLVDRASWYILDLELFGRVQMPLYDLFHMLHICSNVRRPDTPDRRWVERLVAGDQGEAGARDLVRRTAERQALSASTVFATLAYYLVDATARVRARGAWTADWRDYLAQVARLADLILAGIATPDRLLTSARG
jgi:Phosphotransferase enzyme family